MIKFKRWPTIEQVPAIIEKMKSRIASIEIGIENLSIKRVPKRTVDKMISDILANEEDISCLRSLIYCHTYGGLEKFPAKLHTEVDHISSLTHEQYRNILILKDERFEAISDYLNKVVIESDSELITKSLEGLTELYSIASTKEAHTKSGQEICFTAFQTTAGLYRYLENKENSFLRKRLGTYETELSVVRLTEEIKNSAKEVFQQFLGNSNKSMDDIHHTSDLKLRKSFSDSKKTVINFFEEVHPEFGQIAKKIMTEGLIINNRSDTLFAVEAYKRLPRIIVKSSSKLKDEVGMVHELAHGINFVLTNSNNPISNVPMSTLAMEYVPAFFELLFLFSEYKREKRRRTKRAILDYIYHYFTDLFYSQTFTVEVENMLWVELGDSIKTPKDLSKAYYKLIKDYYGGIVEINDSHKTGWIYHHNIFDPQLDLTYLLSFIYGYHSFIRFQSFRMTPDSLKEFLSKGSDADINTIIPLHDFLENPTQYIKEIIDSLAEYNRES